MLRNLLVMHVQNSYARMMRIVLVHGDFGFRSLPENLARCVAAVELAAALKPDLIITPELAASGYGFFASAGVEWVSREVPILLKRFSALACCSETALLLGTPWWDVGRQKHANAAIWIDESGHWDVVHRKICVIPGSERWAEPGDEVEPLRWRGRKVGVLICADAYGSEIANSLAADGAEVLFSPAAWCPGPNGPNGEWERRSAETGLPLFVCNRTGADPDIDFSGSSSGVFLRGKRLLSYDNPAASLLALDVDPQTWKPLSDSFDLHPLMNSDVAGQ